MRNNSHLLCCLHSLASMWVILLFNCQVCKLVFNRLSWKIIIEFKISRYIRYSFQQYAFCKKTLTLVIYYANTILFVRPVFRSLFEVTCSYRNNFYSEVSLDASYKYFFYISVPLSFTTKLFLLQPNWNKYKANWLLLSVNNLRWRKNFNFSETFFTEYFHLLCKACRLARSKIIWVISHLFFYISFFSVKVKHKLIATKIFFCERKF